MAYAPRPTTIFPAGVGSLRQAPANSASSQQNAALQARVNAKRAELENLRQLRDLSGALAGQMTQLQEKLETLRDGTEGQLPSNDRDFKMLRIITAIACVLSNWDSVLRAISLASGNIHHSKYWSQLTNVSAKVPLPSEKPNDPKVPSEKESTPDLPQTLVRIPIAPQAGSAQKTEDQVNGNGAENVT